MAEPLKIEGTTYLKFKKGNVVAKGEEGAKHVKARIIDFGDMKGETTFEVQMESITGVVSRVQVVKGNYGEELLLTIPNAVGKVFMGAGSFEERHMELTVISLSTSGMGYFETLAQKLPAINLDKEVTLKPYDFIPKGKEHSNTGISVMQDGEKITDYFRDDKGKAIHGAPEADIGGEHDDWKEFFEERRKFLKKFIRKNIAEKEEEAQADDLTF